MHSGEAVVDVKRDSRYQRSDIRKRREREALERKSPPLPVKNTGTQKTRTNQGWGTLKFI